MLVYDADEAFSRVVAPYLQEGVDEGEALMAVYVPEKEALLRAALGPAAADVDFADALDVYTRPEDVLATYDAAMRRLLRDGARSIRFIGELPACETEQEWNVWMLYEGLLDHAFTHFPLRVACTYDARVTPAEVLSTSRRVHPRLHHGDWDSGRWQDSTDYDPDQAIRSLTPEPEPLACVRDLPPADDGLSLRRRLAREMEGANIPAERAERMLHAAAEVFANSVRHGAGVPKLRVGLLGPHFVCELADSGAGLDDPVAGYVPPREDSCDPAGLWVARQLAHRVELFPTPGGGLTTRLLV
jgi:hypothetical protein